MRAGGPRAALAAALALAVPGAGAASPSAVQIQLDVAPAPLAGEVPEAAPPRFMLFEDGTVFVGGSSRLLNGRPDKAALRAIADQVDRVRRVPGLGSEVNFGRGATRYRLQLAKGVVITAVGEPGQASAGQKPLADLIEALLRFDDPMLRDFHPAQYAVSAREAKLVGGCRAWTLPVSLPDAVAAPRAVPAEAAADWPTGGVAASVCSGGKSYAVSLRPLLPGERP